MYLLNGVVMCPVFVEICFYDYGWCLQLGGVTYLSVIVTMVYSRVKSRFCLPHVEVEYASNIVTDRILFLSRPMSVNLVIRN